MSLLEVNNIKKSFGKADILKGVSFSLDEGEVLSIIGSSGGGKTTLLRCLNFLEIPNEGEIVLNGKKVFYVENGIPTVAKDAQKGMGMVFQQFNLFPQYSVMDNLLLAPKLEAKKSPDYKQKKKEILKKLVAKAESLLAATGLSEKKDFYPCMLSGGQQQRVAIARALMLEPDILCFDEPTSALDPELTGEVLKVIKKLREEGRTMIIVTHELMFAKHVSDKIIFMADGNICEMGTPEEVIDHPKEAKTQAFIKSDLSATEY